MRSSQTLKLQTIPRHCSVSENDQQKMSTNENNIHSRFNTGVSSNTDTETKSASAWQCYAVYSAENWNVSVLSEYSGTDVKSVTHDYFAVIPDTCMQRHRDLFPNRGVFVACGRGIPVAKALFDATQNESDWPSDDNDYPPTLATNTNNPLYPASESNQEDDPLSTAPAA